jgi:hypothetical protein
LYEKKYLTIPHLSAIIKSRKDEREEIKMKIVTNSCYGGFSLPEEFCNLYGFSTYGDIERTDPRLIGFVESKGGCVKEHCACLVVDEIPDEATDWEISDYDGYESIICVVDGKIRHI